MKKLLSILFLTCCTTYTFAQIMATANSPEYKNICKMSASLFTRNTFQMGYERFTNQNSSVYLSAGLNFTDTDYDKSWGIRSEVQMKFHVYTIIKPTQSNRLYFAPYIMNHYLETQTRNYDNYGNYLWQTDNFDAIGGGMLFGWSYSFANRINLDIYAGGGFRKTINYNPAILSINNSIFDYGYSGIVPRLGIDIGFWF